MAEQAAKQIASTVAHSQKRLLTSGALMTLPTALVWITARHFAPRIEGTIGFADKMTFAVFCAGGTLLFTLVLMIEAVSHMRLFTPAIDPLKGAESHAMVVDLRVLQNTLEQSVVFLVTLFTLAAIAQDADGLSIVFAYSVVWLLSRLVFWLSYQIDQSLRAAGLVGSALSIVLLVWAVAQIAHQSWGIIGAGTVVGLFALAETLLVIRAVRAGWRNR